MTKKNLGIGEIRNSTEGEKIARLEYSFDSVTLIQIGKNRLALQILNSSSLGIPTSSQVIFKAKRMEVSNNGLTLLEEALATIRHNLLTYDTFTIPLEGNGLIAFVDRKNDIKKIMDDFCSAYSQENLSYSILVDTILMPDGTRPYTFFLRIRKSSKKPHL